jgi:hypothetical protein
MCADLDALTVYDTLDMLVTGDPVAELDDALAQATAGLCTARRRGDAFTAALFRVWIDRRLDERLEFLPDPAARDR